MQRTDQSIMNPLFRFLEREMTTFMSLLDMVRNDLSKIKNLCAGTIKQTNELKELGKELYAECVPKKW